MFRCGPNAVAGGVIKSQRVKANKQSWQTECVDSSFFFLLFTEFLQASDVRVVNYAYDPLDPVVE